jgi:LmbE family N-acetylglucosaminyl deacetylase
MGTIVSFHAHPDDESIGTAGTLARAADAGHRVVLVFATRGELGKPVPGSLADGEQLSLRRSAECYASAEILGASRVEFLGFTDSGMMGEPTNDAPYCFWRAPVEHAARRLSVILDEEEPDVLTVYDDEGGYGHPDHIQVHRVGCARPSAAPCRSWRSTRSTGTGWRGGCAGSSRPGRSTGRRGCPGRPRRAGASRNA